MRFRAPFTPLLAATARRLWPRPRPLEAAGLAMSSRPAAAASGAASGGGGATASASASTSSPTLTDIEALHLAACLSSKDGYVDPATGYLCFTEFYHRRRGKCCGSACRHCPFAHAGVPEGKRGLIKGPPVLSGVLEGYGDGVKVVGKGKEGAEGGGDGGGGVGRGGGGGKG